MKVVSQARKVGLELVVAEIFSHPKLQDLCQRFHQVNEPVKEFAPFALLQENCDISSFIQDVASQYQIDASAIEDAYPCTPLQEGLISLTSKHSGDYVLQVKIELSSHIQIDMFCGAWETVVRQLPILRTRIAHHKSMGMLQLVLNEDIRWVNATTLDKYLETDRTYQMSLGQPLTRYALVSDEEGQNRNFVWTVHHALFDGWSMRLIMDAVRQTYLGNPVEKVPQFQSFINHIPDLSDDKMASYWRESLSHCESVPFPMTSSSAKEQPKADQVIEYSMPKIKQSALGITTSSLIRAAWALVAGRMTNSSDVLFGVLQSGRNAPIIDIDKMACPTIATVPLRIKYSKDQKVSDYLDAVQRQSTEMIPFEQSGLHRIAKLSPETRNACMFQTMLVIQPQEIHQEQDAIGKWEYHNQTHWFNTYALLMEVQLGSADITITASFDSAIIKSCVVSNLLKQLEHTINQLNTIDTERNLSQIQTMTPQDLQQIWQWNSKVPKPVHDKIHSMFERFVQSQPDRPAVCAWDGDLTYSELDSLATSLASHLQRLNFTPNYIIPLCFEKSKWVTVSILGVLKAGYGFVLLDPFVPEERLRRIASQVKSNLILSSVSTRDLSSRVGHNIVTICSDFFERVESGALGIANSNSESIAYVVFTSGSTGDPKGITITHTNYSSALHHQASAFMYSPESRVLDFSSHSFDATILNTFTVLNSGGCLCIPNDNDRMNNLTASFVSLRANSALITPSIGQLLSPENVPELKTIIFGGEACRIQDVLPWWGKVRVVNAYGPSECTPASIINHKASSPWEVTMIGKGMGQVTWVVDPDDHEILLPPGCIGELLLEGPLIGQGYLNEPEKTAAAFIKDPSWLLRGGPSHPGRHGRLYKTGDLVQYHEDGSLSYIGRKDAQIKIRGQRVELEEIEHRVRECITNATKVVVEVVFPQGRESSPVVVAFLQLPKQALENTDSEYPNGRLRDISPEVKDSLSKHLPSYMLPRFFISMDRIPINTSGKLNRKLMRDIGGSILTQRLAESQRLVTSKKRPTSDAEQILQLVWSEVLKVETASIGIDDNFFQLGGDSVDAMRVVSDAYHAGLSITVASIFHHPKLSDLAQTGTQVLNGKDKKIQPFALLGNSCDTNFLIQEIASQYQLEMRKIQDLYPCTPLQEGLLSMTLKRPGEFVNQSILKLSSDLSLEEFRRAWEEVVQQIPILRTTIVHHNDFGLLQAVLDTGVEWIIEDSLEQYIQCDRSTVMGLGQPLVRYALIENDGGVWFVWTIHHALYDGWSMPLILDAVTRSYHGQSLGSMAHIQEFVRHIHSQDMTKATEYWTHELAGCEAVSFPSVPASIETPKANAMVEHCSPLLKERSSSTTISTLIRAAWGVAASRMTHSRDVVFGATMSGRSLPVPGIDRMIVPTITTVPIRITLSDDQQVSKYLSAVQKQATEMIPFEQSGLHRIGKMSLDAQRACTFQTLLVVQPYEEQKRTVKPGLGKWQEVNQQEWFDTYALVIEACPRADGVSFTASFDSTVIDSWAVKRLLQRLELVAHQLDTAPGHHTMANIKFTTASDLADIWRWNSTVPEPSQQYVHQMIEEQAKSRPNSPAVCAWDGELTYLELISLSSKLANRLVTIGISAGMLVPLCFEKSMWTSIAMVAVLRAGGAFVLLDASLPEQRLQVIVKQSNARLIVSSYQNRALSARLCPETLIVDSNSLAHLDSQHHQSSIPGLSSTAYAIFTSGTTGTPKGAVITHQNISSAIGHQIGLYEYGPESRVFDFSSYSFDPSIFSALSVFTSGGCLCVPSDQDRQTRLADSISSLRANTLDLTPTIARFLRPSNVPGVHTIILSGEMVHIKDVEPWWPKVRVLNLYGPSECTITSTMNTTASSPEEVLNIGRGAGLLTWIVDPDDHNCLLPPGCTGELILEGPLVGNGYLNDPERTAAAFIKPPKWLIEGTPGESERHARRVYKTGDIVQYNKDGSLKILGRKDTQVKLRGQRVELAEVENGVRSCIPDVKWVIADVIPPRGSNGSPALVAFVQFHKIRADDAEVTLIPIVPDVQSKLNELLPSYMVPVAVFSIKQIPLTTAGKTDRPRLRELGGQMSIGSSGEIAYGSKPSLESNANERYILDTEETAYALAEKISSMCALWAQVSLGCNGDTTPNKARKYQDVPLHSCGLDSVSVMSLMYYLSQSFHVNVSLKLLMSRETTIRGLARIVSSLQASGLNGSLAHTPTPEPETVHLITEVNKLDSKIADLQRSSVECGDGSLSLNNKPLVVLLTGSTGFIGTQILRQLLEHGQVDTVIALVRSETADSARGRIIDAARKALWWTEFHADKLFVWQGDLALPRLGLDPAHYSTLSESNSIDIIIHNGAVVHWGKGYRDLETVNVSSTVTLLQHAVTKPHMRFVYVTGGLQWADGESEELVAQELSLEHTNGYSQTKFVSEAVVRRAALRDKSRPGHLGIVSPGLVIGTSTEGVANSDDYIWRLALACIRLRAYNADMASTWLPVSDAAAMASDIVNAALQPSKTVTCATGGMIWADFWAILEYMGYTLKPTSGKEWLAAIRADIELEREAHPLWPLAHMIESQNTRKEHEDVFDDLHRKNTPIRLKVAVMRNVEFLARVGFLPPITGSRHSPNLDQHLGSFSRSGIYV